MSLGIFFPELLGINVDKLDKELDALVHFEENGGGFGDREAKEQHDRKIELLKFKITRRDNYKIAIMSALIGAIVGTLITFIS